MKRHHYLSAGLGFVALCAVVAAFLLGGKPPANASTAVRGTSTTTSPSAVTSTPSTTVAAAADPSGIGSLLASLDSAWAQTRRPSTSCLMVLKGTHVVYERNPDLRVTPASTMKLLTATAVLARIDANERLRTPVLTAAPFHDGVVDGDVYLVGGGDPVLGTVDWAAHFERQPRLFTSIETLADRLVALGVREVRGRIVGDDGRFDRERYVSSWPQNYRDDNETGPLSALTVNDGFASWDQPDPEDIPWDDPPRDAAAVLTALLRARGVLVDQEPAAGAVAPNAVELAAVESPTIGQLISAMLEDSDNGTAELLLKELGLRVKGAGTTANGAQVVAETLTGLGMPMQGVTIHDGSGLDHGDHVTCRLLTSLLNHAAPDGPIASGLPIAAQTGTLYKRFLATPIAGHLRAKTGSITGVAALAGFADGKTGELTFAQVLNGIGTYADALRVQYALGNALVGL